MIMNVHVWGRDVGAYVGATWSAVARLVSTEWRARFPKTHARPRDTVDWS